MMLLPKNAIYLSSIPPPCLGVKGLAPTFSFLFYTKGEGLIPNLPHQDWQHWEGGSRAILEEASLSSSFMAAIFQMPSVIREQMGYKAI
jgi:hypothetical protein